MCDNRCRAERFDGFVQRRQQTGKTGESRSLVHRHPTDDTESRQTTCRCIDSSRDHVTPARRLRSTFNAVRGVHDSVDVLDMDMDTVLNASRERGPSDSRTVNASQRPPTFLDSIDRLRRSRNLYPAPKHDNCQDSDLLSVTIRKRRKTFRPVVK